MDEELNKQFEALTEGMALEKLYAQMADRADIARKVAMHAGEVYKEARQSGLPRSLSLLLAKGYWDSEMSPVTTYLVGGEG